MGGVRSGQPRRAGVGVLLATVGVVAACNALPLASPLSSMGSEVATPTPASAPMPDFTPTPHDGPSTPPPADFATPTPEASVVPYTNPNGPDWSGKAPDTYPVIEQAQRLATYAGLWFDPNQIDLHIAVTSDIDGAIAKLGKYVPRGVTVYFQLAPESEADLEALTDKIFNDYDSLREKGIVLSSGAPDQTTSRVEITMSPAMPETIAYMQQLYPGPIDYTAGDIVPLQRYDPPGGDVLVIAVTGDQLSGLLTCGQRPFPETGLQSAPVDVNSPGLEFDALRQAFDTYRDAFGDLSPLPWILVERDDYGATFLTQRDSGWLEEMVVAGAGGWVPSTLSECTPRPFTADDGGPATWALNPAFPAPEASSTELHLLIVENACASASSPVGRVLPPIVDYGTDTLTANIRVRPIGGIANCPGNPSQAITVVLPQPLGGRSVVGGVPPAQLQ